MSACTKLLQASSCYFIKPFLKHTIKNKTLSESPSPRLSNQYFLFMHITTHTFQFISWKILSKQLMPLSRMSLSNLSQTVRGTPSSIGARITPSRSIARVLLFDFSQSGRVSAHALKHRVDSSAGIRKGGTDLTKMSENT